MRRPVQLRELHWRENRARALLWVRGLLFFLSTGIWVVPGAEFCRILHKTLSKVKHIARPACRPALKQTLLHRGSRRALGGGDLSDPEIVFRRSESGGGRHPGVRTTCYRASACVSASARGHVRGVSE